MKISNIAKIIFIMTNSKVLFDELVKAFRLEDSPGEIITMAFMVLEKSGVTRNDILKGKQVDHSLSDFNDITDRINRGEPIQYVLGEAWFYGRKFAVNSSVLIPRPETERLVQLALEEIGQGEKNILDIGTGSGCIAITLALENPMLKVTGCDVSESALRVAKQNAVQLGAGISLTRHDILQEHLSASSWAAIISNPPYVSIDEKSSLKKNVMEHEPALALFAGNDPLVFYKAIAHQARKGLSNSGFLLVEINKRFPQEVMLIFSLAGFQSISVLKDLNGKARFVKGLQP